mmetsp:Transcript_21745/g.35217  ORF Transcript_21745/g.35217 Transcript_21745/m.35217 type:complete len:138 (-) Transcript_21745:224-637(-)|eukprot:CAMPEP_0198691076 /NCGR_PEP_ID=MMETSP1468-20131203/195381_1 /TAXON_ID=1461545 /ORGANISM="Mantoniella sp, Strain CCMP1436" /LENGTH=137 /DNA_ID=CAMNT_0044443985 /DNA_START=911 /DNA_END=1324 /DNA_ORIENTATION=-
MVCFIVASAPSGTEYVGMSVHQFRKWCMPTVHSSALMALTVDEFAAEMMCRQEDQAPRCGGGHAAGATVHVFLTGLISAAHLNDRQGVLKGQDPNNSERFIVYLLDGKKVNVRSHNYKLVQRFKVFVHEFDIMATGS